MAQAFDIYHLINQPIDRRGKDWESAFLQAFTEAKVSISSPDPRQGPDGWPYLMVENGPDATEPATKVIGWLSDKGIGLTLNAQKGVPDYVFTYGMLWNFRERGQFITESDRVNIGSVKFEKGQEVMSGPPSPEFLPDYVRTILRKFFADQGVSNMNILVISGDQKHFDLCFSLESLGNPVEAEHRGICEAISWFLPSHYSIVLTQESGMPEFHPL